MPRTAPVPMLRALLSVPARTPPLAMVRTSPALWNATVMAAPTFMVSELIVWPPAPTVDDGENIAAPRRRLLLLMELENAVVCS